MPNRPLQLVLCVDDDRDICEVVTAALGLTAGLEVRTAASGEQAIEVARRQTPDLFLMDMMMPGLDGRSTLARLREIEMLAHIPVVFLTAKTGPHAVARALEWGAMGLIAKPFDPLMLCENLLAVWNGAAPSDTAVASLGPATRHLDPLARSFIERARRDAKRIGEMVRRVRDGDRSALRDIAAVAHSLHGTGALFGFLAISGCGGALERHVEDFVASAPPHVGVESGTLLQIEACAAQLAQAIALASETVTSRTAMCQSYDAQVPLGGNPGAQENTGGIRRCSGKSLDVDPGARPAADEHAGDQ